jgi:hypothetical protein
MAATDLLTGDAARAKGPLCFLRAGFPAFLSNPGQSQQKDSTNPSLLVFWL